MDFCLERNLQYEFKEGIFDKLAEKEEISQFDTKENKLKKVRIWQLKPSSDFSMRFISFDELMKNFGKPDKNNYKVVFDGELPTDNLESIYEICNLNQPDGYEGHALSISDVIELYDTQSKFYYVDKIGFKEIDFNQHTETEEQTNQN